MGRRGIVVLVLLSVAACAQPEAVTTANVPGRAHPVAVDLPGSTSPTTAAPTGAPPTGTPARVTVTPEPPAGSPSAEKPPGAPAEQAPLPGPYRQFASALNGLCVNLDAAGTGDGVAVIQWPCKDDQPQSRWGWAGGYGTDIYKIVSQHSGKCVDVSGASISDGARVVQMPCRDSGGSQLWRRTWFAKSNGWNYWRLQNVHSGLCLDVPEESKEWGQYLWQYTCHQGAAQQFRTPA